MSKQRNNAEQVYYGAQCAVRNLSSFHSSNVRQHRLFIIELAMTMFNCTKLVHDDLLGADLHFPDGSSLRVNRDSTCSFNVAAPIKDFDTQLKAETLQKQHRKSLFIAKKQQERSKGVKRK